MKTNGPWKSMLNPPVLTPPEGMIHVDQILIPPRQRKDFNGTSLMELTRSIESLGLFHALVLYDDGKTLAAGERRLRAIKNLFMLGKTFSYGGKPVPEGYAPITRLSQLDEASRLEVEIHENLQREDFTWQEKAEALNKLAKLREIQTGQSPTPAAIAEEVHGRSDGWFQDSTRKTLIVAKHLDDPEIAKAKSVEDAFKLLKVRESQRRNAERGAELPGEVLRGQHRLLLGDFRAVELGPDESYDCIITDPPYNIGADDYRDGTGKATGGHTYDDQMTPEEWEELMHDAATTAWRLLKPNSHCYFFCDIENFFFLRKIFQELGFRVWRKPFIMYRTTSVRAPWQECGPWASYETILYAMKGKKACTAYRHDVITVRGDENLGMSAQKPVAIYKDLLERSVYAGGKVLDLFCGTGTIFPAAHELKLIATGVEKSPAHAAIAEGRLKELA